MCMYTVIYSINFSRAAQLYRDKIANQAAAAQKMYGTKVLYGFCIIQLRYCFICSRKFLEGII